DDNMSIRAASVEYEVDRKTLGRYVTEVKEGNETAFKADHNSSQIFSPEEENDLEKYLLTAARLNCGLTPKELQRFAYEYAVTRSKPISDKWKKNNQTSYDWERGFMHHHLRLSLWNPQTNSLGRGTAFNPSIDEFFQDLRSVYHTNKFGPESIYNLDETGVTNVQKPGKVIAPKGEKQVSKMRGGHLLHFAVHRVLTDTPVKAAIEKEYEECVNRKRKQATLPSKTIKKIFPNDCEDSVSIEKERKKRRESHFTPTADEDECEEMNNEDWEVMSAKSGDFVLVKFCTKSTACHYVGKVIQIREYECKMPRSKTGVTQPERTKEDIELLTKAANAVLRKEMTIRKPSLIHYGLSTKQVKSLACDFSVARNIRHPPSWNANKATGKHFYHTFDQHKDKISLRKLEATSLARSTVFNRATVRTFFSKYQEIMEKYHFSPENIYNVDESGITTVHLPERVVAPKGVKQVGAMTSGERGSNITIISSINVIGISIPPMMIFPRVNFRDAMLKGASSGTIGQAHISVGPSSKKRKSQPGQGAFAMAFESIAYSLSQPITMAAPSCPVDTCMTFLGSVLKEFKSEQLKLDVMNSLVQAVINAKSTDL
ncbi:hypothetical protein ANN_24518, partial [Periplaneta americana]